MFDNYGHREAAPLPPPPPARLHFDSKYVKSLPGLLKLIELACNFIGFICIKVSWTWVSAIFYNILYWVGICITGALLLCYTFHVVEKYSRWPWLKLELFYCGAMAFSFICLSIFAATIGESVGYAVGFFGFCSIILYGFDGYLKYKSWKSGSPPQ